MHRALVMLIVIVSLSGAYGLYATFVLPLTESRAAPLIAVPEQPQNRPAGAYEQLAKQHFPDQSWTKEAEQAWQIGEHAHLYYRKHERVVGSGDQGKGNTIRFSPVALLWQDPRRPNAAPFRMIAESAQVKFENPFFDAAIALSSANPGRIVWASLEGAVHIDGPDGLRIDGRDFYFSEEPAQLYSDRPVAFAYGPTPRDGTQLAGTAEQATLAFVPSEESVLGKDMPRVSGLKDVMLRRNVVLDLAFAQGGQPRRAHVTSAGSFEYDVLKMLATFAEQVRVTQQTQAADGAPQLDTLVCDWLGLQFEEAPPTEGERKLPAAGGLADGLVFRQLRALGSARGQAGRLTLFSQAQGVKAVMQDLLYDAAKRQVKMLDQERVIVERGTMKFACPQVGLQHSPTNEIEQFVCRGAGQVEFAEPSLGGEPLTARWAGHVEVQPDAESGVHEVRLERNAQLSLPGQFGVAANVLRMWVDLKRIPEAPTPAAGGAATSGGAGNPLAAPLALRRARGEGQVRMASPLAAVRRAELIDVSIRPGLLPAEEAQTGNDQGGGAKQQPNPWMIEADQMHLELIHDASAGRIDFRRALAEGSVRVEQEQTRAMAVGSSQLQGPLVLTGASLLAENAGGLKQSLTLRGEFDERGELKKAASLGLGAARLRGGHVTLDRAENQVDVNGAGSLAAPLPQNLDGTALAAPTTLEIVWRERMAFDGLTVSFWGAVTAAVPTDQTGVSRLLCENLNAQLNRKISFTQPEAAPADLGIETVEARHHVVLEAYQYEQRSLAAVRRGELSSIRLVQSSGEFEGAGPGELSSWTRGGNVKFASSEQAEANQPARQTTPRWQYANVRFEGQIRGNMRRHDAVLDDRVKVIAAPVGEALTRFQSSQITEATPEAENAVYLQCDKLRIVQPAAPNQERRYTEIFATGGTDLEGHVFRAKADELTFEERLGRFTLRGLGRDARLFHQPQPGVRANTSEARMIIFEPATRYVSTDRLKGINSGL